MAAPCSATSGRCISRSASAPASISLTAPICCPITASSAPSRSSTASPPRSAISATGISPMSASIWATRSTCSSGCPTRALRFVYLLHPDPWPKARHAKRRMVNPGPLDLIAAKLEPGGEFRLVTDDPVYCRWAMMVMGGRRDFEWLAEARGGFPRPPGRLAGDALRGQGAARGPRGLVFPLPPGVASRTYRGGNADDHAQHLPGADLRRHPRRRGRGLPQMRAADAR